LLDGSVSKL
jgi:dehydrogenase/reductase SDR family protein 1